MLRVTLHVDGTTHHTAVDTRTSLLDALRQRLGITSPKKGCDHGQCGACTILVRGRRVLSCLTLAAANHGAEVITAAGLGSPGTGGEHPVQRAFVEHDALQCGYCTPGQVCSAVGALAEFADGQPSAAAGDVAADPDLDGAEIAERMSGNLCRCGAYVNIRAAVAQAAAELGLTR